jgi:hypothetical protein
MIARDLVFFGSAALMTLGCDAGPTGDVRIDLEAEETITHGLSAGTGEENVIDGWTITYTRFVAIVGDVHLGRLAEGI